MKKLYLIAGEASGDLHGSNLLKALHTLHPNLACRAWGGDLMGAAGTTIAKHYRDLAFMGFVEVLRNIKTILGNIAFCKEDILAFNPDALVLIDYPGFNLRIAKWAKKQGIPVIYYISPQIWAWHQSRVHQIKRDVDLMMVILPFERAFYKKHGVEAVYVGHPLLDAVQSLQANTAGGTYPPRTIAVLPGSRVQEIKNMLPKMLSVAPYFPDYQFIVAGTNNFSAAYYAQFLGDYPNVQLIQGDTYGLLQHASAALVKSGTSTLEAALFNVPQVVCYAGNPISYHIAKRLIRVKYISLVNLIADKPLVKELIQEELRRENIRIALQHLLEPSNTAALKAEYRALRQQLGEGGASKRAAETILQHVSTISPQH